MAKRKQAKIELVAKPEISQPDPNYDGFIVIGAGLPRTGTLSLQTALTQLLKGPCYHMFLVISSKKTDPGMAINIFLFIFFF